MNNFEKLFDLIVTTTMKMKMCQTASTMISNIVRFPLNIMLCSPCDGWRKNDERKQQEEQQKKICDSTDEDDEEESHQQALEMQLRKREASKNCATNVGQGGKGGKSKKKRSSD